MQLVAWIITPLMPMFAVYRYGKLDNGNDEGFGLRLPELLFWFDTPDNSISGDSNWLSNHNSTSYLSHIGWLYRNSIYGFKWTVLACKNQHDVKYLGNPWINRNNGQTGYFFASMSGGYWQYKVVKKIYKDFGIMFNFGWQLDDFVKTGIVKPALFQFSPRFVTIR